MRFGGCSLSETVFTTAASLKTARSKMRRIAKESVRMVLAPVNQGERTHELKDGSRSMAAENVLQQKFSRDYF